MKRRSESTIGFHGTDKANVSSILAGGFRLSNNSADWLGAGAYFFQDAPSRAKEWARTHCSDPAVIGVEISLDGCMDLLDTDWWKLFRDVFNAYRLQCLKQGAQFPRQRGKFHGLDKMIVDLVRDGQVTIGKEIKSVRGIFKEGDSVYPGSAFNDLDHVQISVNSNDIIIDRWIE